MYFSSKAKTAPRYINLILLFLLTPLPGFAWVNQDFETGDFTGWTGTLNYTLLGASSFPTTLVVGPGPAPGTNGSLCPAPATCLNMVHSGNYAAQIYSGNGDSNHGDWARLEQSDIVPASAPFISFWFAAVLSGAHFNNLDPAGSDTYVQFEVLGTSGPIYSNRFSWYDNAGALVDDGSALVNGPWKHLPWTQYYFDMSAYIGQPVTVRYTTYSCWQTAHSCWGYMDNAEWLNASQVPTNTPTPTETPTSTPTNTPTETLTPTDTFTPCMVGGNTCTITDTPTFTNTPTPTPTITPTDTFTATETPTSTITNTPTITFTPTCQMLLWPNPFNPHYAYGNVLKISCLPDGSKVSFYTLSGEKVADLSGGVRLFNEDRTVVWDGKNSKGIPVSDGVYFYVIELNDKVFKSGKVIVLNSQ